MLAVKFLPYLLLLLCWCVGGNDEPKATDSGSDTPSSTAEDISKDMSGLAAEVDGITENASPKEEESTTEEDLNAKQKDEYEEKYEAALNKGLEEGKASYKKYEHASVEKIDLLELASDYLKKHWYIGQCRRQYSLRCPNGWEWKEEDGLCVAPQDYQGPCKHLKDFRNMKEQERDEYSWRCHVSWPCVNDLPIDGNYLCPMEWIKISSTLCLAPTSYAGICPPISEFEGMTVLEKTVYEHMCDVKWPRLSNINGDSSSAGVSMMNLGDEKGINAVINDLGVMVPI